MIGIKEEESGSLWQRAANERRAFQAHIWHADDAVVRLNPSKPPLDWPSLELDKMLRSFGNYIGYLHEASMDGGGWFAATNTVLQQLDREYGCLLSAFGLALLAAHIRDGGRGTGVFMHGSMVTPRLRRFIDQRERISRQARLPLPSRWSDTIAELRLYRPEHAGPPVHGLVLTEAYRVGVNHEFVRRCLSRASQIGSYQGGFG